MKYEAEYVPGQFFESWGPGYRQFELPTDEEAIQYAENPESHHMPLRFVIPSEGTCGARIRRLVEIMGPEGERRLVKEW